jgi:superoxide dismutase, Fe-Mn family
MPYEVPPLSYDYAALDGTEWADKPIEEVVANLSQPPTTSAGPVRNNGGGHLNHTLFWESMSPAGGGAPDGDLAQAIDDAFGSFDDFKAKVKDAGVGQFGSGSSTTAPASPSSPPPTRATPSATARRPCIGPD